MIFGLLAFLWVLTATTLLMLVPPVMFVLIRGSYLDRKLFPVIQWIPVMAALMVLLYMLQISEKPFMIASLEAGKILASSFVLIHLGHGILKDGAANTGARLGTLLLLIQRCMILEKRLITNAVYSVQIRLRHGGVGVSETISLFLGMILTITSELLRLAEEIRRLYKSRGSNPVNMGWVVPASRKVYVWIGDIVLILLIGVVLKFGLDILTPESIIEIYSSLLKW